MHSPTSSRELRGALFVLLAAVLWGTTGTSQALAPPQCSPQSIGALRLLIGGIALAAVAFAATRRLPFGLDMGKTAIAGVLVACYQLFFFWGVALTGVAVGTMVAIGSAPIFAGLLELIWLRRSPTAVWLISTALAILGCVFLLGYTAQLNIKPAGLLLAAGAGFSYAFYSLLMKKLLIGHRPESVAAAVFCIGALALLPFLFNTDLSWVATGRGLLVVIHLGIIATALSYYLFCRGLERVNVSTGVTLSLAEPFTAALLGVALLGERLGNWGWIGLGLIISGLILLVIKGNRGAELGTR
jgi:DME family drug/metabolite transporter